MSFNTIIDWNSCTAEQQRQLLMRPAISASESITRTVNDILDNVKTRGDEALREYSAKFDKTTVTALKVSADEIAAASERLSDELKQAMAVAVKNIETFHTAQKLPPVDVETQPGVRCQQVTRPVASVGLYIPGGSAPLFSTVLMLATPARIAGCKKVVLCSPPPIADEILYAAQLCGVQDVFNVGGAQAIAALAFGTESVPKVDKIFGPGNAFVTEAKRQVSQRLDGAAIDMPAGPSEVLVIADSGATPDFVASDLLSQAEHGPELIPEGEAGLLRRQKEGRFLLIGAFHRPLFLSGKAMLGHTVPLAVQLVAVVLKTSGHGEQNGRAARPDGGIALPETLDIVLVPNGLDLRAQRGNLHGQFFVFQGYDAHNVTPLS